MGACDTQKEGTLSNSTTVLAWSPTGGFDERVGQLIREGARTFIVFGKPEDPDYEKISSGRLAFKPYHPFTGENPWPSRMSEILEFLELARNDGLLPLNHRDICTYEGMIYIDSKRVEIRPEMMHVNGIGEIYEQSGIQVSVWTSSRLPVETGGDVSETEILRTQSVLDAVMAAIRAVQDLANATWHDDRATEAQAEEAEREAAG